jgi:hypothetical protein
MSIQHAPLLATRNFKAGQEGERVPTVFRVKGGLHYIKDNSAPYFSLTYERHRAGFPNQCWSCGAGHEAILKFFPKFADLAALHLSDIKGVPTHVEANGWYWIAGALGGMGEQFHGGNSQQHFPKIAIDPKKPWDMPDYRNPPPEECIGIFAKHIRVSYETAKQFIGAIETADDPKKYWARLVPTMHARWRAEADACIEKHGLVVFGDEWCNAEVVA